MMRKSGRQVRRLMKKMDMKIEELSNVNQVVIRASTKEIVINRPAVTLTRMQGQDIYQVMGGEVSEKKITKEVNILEEDRYPLPKSHIDESCIERL